jgi:hypothetical protein
MNPRRRVSGGRLAAAAISMLGGLSFVLLAPTAPPSAADPPCTDFGCLPGFGGNPLCSNGTCVLTLSTWLAWSPPPGVTTATVVTEGGNGGAGLGAPSSPLENGGQGGEVVSTLSGLQTTDRVIVLVGTSGSDGTDSEAGTGGVTPDPFGTNLANGGDGGSAGAGGGGSLSAALMGGTASPENPIGATAFAFAGGGGGAGANNTEGGGFGGSVANVAGGDGEHGTGTSGGEGGVGTSGGGQGGGTGGQGQSGTFNEFGLGVGGTGGTSPVAAGGGGGGSGIIGGQGGGGTSDGSSGGGGGAASQNQCFSGVIGHVVVTSGACTLSASSPGGGVDTITYPEPPVITTTSPLPQGTVGLPYTTSLAATSGAGATNTWSLQSGQLPAGLTLNADGVISGTPTSAGTSTVVVGVDDPVTATLSITIAAAPGTPVISSTPTAGATTTALTTPSTLAVSGAMLGPELLGGTLLVTLGSALLVMRRLRRRTATPATN